MNITWDKLVTPEYALAHAKSTARVRLEQVESAKRALIVTPILGQELLYTLQANEAAAYLSVPNQELTESQFPMLFEAVKSGKTAKDVADVWWSRSLETSRSLARLETVRQRTLAAIDSARTQEQVDSALADYMKQE